MRDHKSKHEARAYNNAAREIPEFLCPCLLTMSAWIAQRVGGQNYHKSSAQSLWAVIQSPPIRAMFSQSAFAFALVPILALLPSVTAHGFVNKVVIDGTSYDGNIPQDDAGSKSSASPIRQIFDIGPVKGASNPDLNCGMSAQLASMVVPANPGSVMQFYWGNPGAENVSREPTLSRASFAHSSRVLCFHALSNTAVAT